MEVWEHVFEILRPVAIGNQFTNRFITFTCNEQLLSIFFSEVIASRCLGVFHVEEDFRALSLKHPWQNIEGRDGQCCANYDAKIYSILYLVHNLSEFRWQSFSKEDDSWLDRAAATFTAQDDLVADRLLQCLVIGLLLALCAMSTPVGTMSLNDIIHVHSCFLLQVVDVLRRILPQNALVL